MNDLEKLLVDNRLVTLTGAGGAGKTRLAVEIAARIAPEFRDGVWYVDLAPVTHPGVVPVTVARALDLPDQPGRSTMDTLLRFVRDRHTLVVTETNGRNRFAIARKSWSEYVPLQLARNLVARWSSVGR